MPFSDCFSMPRRSNMRSLSCESPMVDFTPVGVAMLLNI